MHTPEFQPCKLRGKQPLHRLTSFLLGQRGINMGGRFGKCTAEAADGLAFDVRVQAERLVFCIRTVGKDCCKRCELSGGI